jgi:hypothetical protein
MEIGLYGNVASNGEVQKFFKEVKYNTLKMCCPHAHARTHSLTHTCDV